MRTLLISFFLIISSATTAQKNVVFLEFGGNGGIASINYERQITQNRGLSLRAGVGMTFFDFVKEKVGPTTVDGCVLCGIDIPAPEIDLTIPMSVQYLFNLNSNNYLETGLGYTWQLADNEGYESGNDKKSIHVFHGAIGFRRNFGTHRKWMWKLNFTPILGVGGKEVDRHSEPTIWGGLSIGKRF